MLMTTGKPVSVGKGKLDESIFLSQIRNNREKFSIRQQTGAIEYNGKANVLGQKDQGLQFDP